MGFMGLGKWTYEVDKAADATESRRKLDVEIEETDEMRQKKLVCRELAPGHCIAWVGT
jgi:hypothetical protein